MNRIVRILIALGALVAINANARILHVPEDYQTIQAGIDAAEAGDTVLVQPGVYRENLVIEDRNIVLGSMILITNDAAYIDSTVLDGNVQHSVIRIRGDEESSLVRGFSIRNGRWTRGGGIYCFDSTHPVFEDLQICENRATEWGGGIYAEMYSQPTFRRVRIIGNRGDANGGGAFFLGASPILEDCAVTGNSSQTIAAIYAVIQTIEIHSTLIADNVSDLSAEAVFFGISGGEERATLDHLTIAGNEPDEDAIGAILVAGGETTISNSIIYGNMIDELLIARGGQLLISHSDVLGGEADVILRDSSRLSWEDSNIDTDPLLLDPDNGDYHLSPDSPCIDAGDPDAPLDPDGTRADMGAFYFHQRDIELSETELWDVIIEEADYDSVRFEVANVGGTPLHLIAIRTFAEGIGDAWTIPEIDTTDAAIELFPDSSLNIWIYYRPFTNQVLVRLLSDDPDEPAVMVRLRSETADVRPDQLSASRFQLFPVFPNPFNSTTMIRFSNPGFGETGLWVYGIDGRLVTEFDGRWKMENGTERSVVWDAVGLSAGSYLIKFEAGGVVRTERVILVK